MLLVFINMSGTTEHQMDIDVNWIGIWGTIHISVKFKLSQMTKINARRWLKQFGYTHSQQNALIRNSRILEKTI